MTNLVTGSIRSDQTRRPLLINILGLPWTFCFNEIFLQNSKLGCSIRNFDLLFKRCEIPGALTHHNEAGRATLPTTWVEPIGTLHISYRKHSLRPHNVPSDRIIWLDFLLLPHDLIMHRCMPLASIFLRWRLYLYSASGYAVINTPVAFFDVFSARLQSCQSSLRVWLSTRAQTGLVPPQSDLIYISISICTSVYFHFMYNTKQGRSSQGPRYRCCAVHVILRGWIHMIQ